MDVQKGKKHLDKDGENSKVTVRLTKTAKSNLRKKSKKEAKRIEKAKKPLRQEEPVLPSSISLPVKTEQVGDAIDDSSLLTEIRKRMVDLNEQTVKVSPVPKKCAPLVLHDLCPSAVSVRIPSKRNCRYAFVEFKSAAEASAAAKAITGKELCGKLLSAEICGSGPAKAGRHWKTPTERTLDDFDLKSLFVTHLPRFTERTALAQIFRNAKKINLEKLPDGTCKGFCMLTYTDENEAKRAFLKFHGTRIKGIPISVNFQLKKKEKSSEPEKTELITKETNGKTGRNLKRKAPADDAEHPEKVDHGHVSKKRRIEVAKSTSKTGAETAESPINKSPKAKKARNCDSFVISKAPKETEPPDLKFQPYQLTRKSDKKQKKVIKTK